MKTERNEAERTAVTSKEEAIEKIARLERLSQECETAGLIGAALDNEREIGRLKRQWRV